MEFLTEMGLFSGKVLVVAGAIGILLVLFFALIAKARQEKSLLRIENLNRKYDDMAHTLKAAVLDPKSLKLELKAQKKKDKREKKDRSETSKIEQKRIYVLDFEGDIRATHLENLRHEITSVLTAARPGKDEIVVRVESPGGMVHAYGLAAAQLMRVRDAGLQLTVCVDKVAASGGYMMACTAHQILSAPFAIIGSIGVVAQVPNFHRLLKKHDVDFEEITAGEFKRTISLFGEITERGKRKFLEQIEDTHGLFKAFVKTCRPQLDLDQVATGEYWFGQRAKDLLLVDEILSSDEYLFRQREQAQIYKVEIHMKKRITDKLAENFARLFSQALERAWERSGELSRLSLRS
ncbi:MAG: protease SohB [Bdellovibrionales bacterium]